jgi:hypothetical protein
LAHTPFTSSDVAAVFDSFPEVLSSSLMHLRQTIFEVAAEAEIGGLIETLKWGEPAYLSSTPRTGTTVRINAVKGTQGAYALYVPCQTTLIETFKRHYPYELSFEGNRAIMFDVAAPPPIGPLKHCIALALTYHRRAKQLCDE